MCAVTSTPYNRFSVVDAVEHSDAEAQLRGHDVSSSMPPEDRRTSEGRRRSTRGPAGMDRAGGQAAIEGHQARLPGTGCLRRTVAAVRRRAARPPGDGPRGAPGHPPRERLPIGGSRPAGRPPRRRRSRPLLAGRAGFGRPRRRLRCGHRGVTPPEVERPHGPHWTVGPRPVEPRVRGEPVLPTRTPNGARPAPPGSPRRPPGPEPVREAGSDRRSRSCTGCCAMCPGNRPSRAPAALRKLSSGPVAPLPAHGDPPGVNRRPPMDCFAKPLRKRTTRAEGLRNSVP